MDNEDKAVMGRPVKYNTNEELEEAVESYFENEAKVQMDGYVSFQPTMAGLARSVGLSRQGLLNYSKKEDFFDTIKDARLRVEEALENRLYGNSPAGAIFNLKNNFGWNDKSEVDQTIKGNMNHEHSIQPMGDAVTALLRKKLEDSE